MVTDCKNCPLRQHDLFQPMSKEEVERTQKFKSGELSVDAGTPILMEGSNAPQIYTALRGMGLRYKIMPDGRRQVVNFIFPGDFIGLQAGLIGEMGHSVEASTHMKLCVFDRKDFFDFFRNSTSRAFDVTWLAASEEHFLGEALATVGQRTALAGVAWALTQLFMRADARNMVQNDTMPLPFRQQDLADALGLSLVHTNKTLARLRERQLANWSDRRLVIHDLEELAKVAEMELNDLRPRPLI
ncbi:Crp/Fnr family transcriptional regulator [Roseobacter denitrificans]|uniref:Nitrogen fixation regulatory protein fixK, putative n=1 Tax=Roseobacter denitrificans (strain ATCC 33942 / OCh 114) TaxID=375451 RepID=Q166S6_ROSDO|nr:Crp/Fnr family transcriptional regulator [Roseobacter denitrificans]ABG32017.1 nitrogen fixation regulatory protein fixK, putative [Roseobacter denitrificans OCh 114]AVL51548.1 Crp/Fnr family transcriptional regulator [Roseobacter denitrificans]SFG36385.1 cAMP-binding domain of CRP or a regulatory subunit of cAMP-dependent protein kinases [Roseobacter denitrificans OCh 114]